MHIEQTNNGVMYIEAIVNQDGARFILFPDKKQDTAVIAGAIRELKANRDVVAIRVATEDDRDEQYRTKILRNPLVHALHWYEINADDHKLLRRERKKDTTIVAFIEKYVLPNVAETTERNRKKYGDSIFKI